MYIIYRQLDNVRPVNEEGINHAIRTEQLVLEETRGDCTDIHILSVEELLYFNDPLTRGNITGPGYQVRVVYTLT